MKTFDTSGENVSMTRFVRNDGKTEFYVSRLGINQAETCKINYVKGELSLGSCEMKHLVRAIEIKGKHVLLGQEFRREWGFRKTVFVLKEEGAGFSRSDVSIRAPRIKRHRGARGFYSSGRRKSLWL